MICSKIFKRKVIAGLACLLAVSVVVIDSRHRRFPSHRFPSHFPSSRLPADKEHAEFSALPRQGHLVDDATEVDGEVARAGKAPSAGPRRPTRRRRSCSRPTFVGRPRPAPPRQDAPLPQRLVSSDGSLWTMMPIERVWRLARQVGCRLENFKRQPITTFVLGGLTPTLIVRRLLLSDDRRLDLASVPVFEF